MVYKDIWQIWLKVIVFVIDGSLYQESLNAFRKLVWELSVEEVAPLNMWAQQGQQIGGAHNSIGSTV